MSVGPRTRQSGAAAVVAFFASTSLAGCGDQGPASGPGVLTATVESPHGAEGAAMLELVGDGIVKISPIEGRVFSEHHGDTVLVVVVNDAGGSLRFGVEVTDTTHRPVGTLLEVTGPDDVIRGLGGYALDIRR